MNLGNILGQILQQGVGQQGRSRLDHAMGAGGIGEVLGGILGGRSAGGAGGLGGGTLWGAVNMQCTNIGQEIIVGVFGIYA